LSSRDDRNLVTILPLAENGLSDSTLVGFTFLMYSCSSTHYYSEHYELELGRFLGFLMLSIYLDIAISSRSFKKGLVPVFPSPSNRQVWLFDRFNEPPINSENCVCDGCFAQLLKIQ
jgi:hypothetical protein